MKKYLAPSVIFRLILVAMALTAIVGSGVAQAAPGPPGREPAPPAALLAIRNRDTAVTPNPLSKGVPMTYTFSIVNESASTLDATDATLELPFVGDQQFVSFSSDNANWKVREPVTSTVYVDLGTVKIGQSGTVTIHATFANNYEQTIFRQTVSLVWLNVEEKSWWKTQGVNLTVPVTLPALGPAPTVPDPTPGTGSSSGGSSDPTSGPFARLGNPGTPNTDTLWYFPATGHTLSGDFLNYWLSRSSAIAPQAGLLALGYPISEQFEENGHTVQYFERAVLELWPDNPPDYRVLVQALGRDLGNSQPAITSGTLALSAGSVYFAETGHWLDGRFVDTWTKFGGLRQFGFPIGEAVVQGDKLIQWTERTRFELDLSRPDQLVMLGLTGREAAQVKGYLPS
jgi:hypothetical protein